jgi:hypothetical protein
MSYAATAQDETEDRYYTQVEAGDVRLFTLDQLDAAFNAGLIHENTYVCLEGDSKWLTLAEVAGLGDEEPEAPPVSGPAPVPYHGVAASRSVMPAPYSSPYYVPPSIAPVVNDLALDDDDMMMSMRPKRRLGKVVGGLAVLALAGLGFMVVQSGGLKGLKLPGGLDKSLGQSAAASLSLPKQESTPAIKEIPRAVAEAPKPEPLKVEEPKPTETASTTAKADASDDKSEAKKSEDRFSEEMKEALLNKDKKEASKSKGKKAARAAVAAKRSSGKAKSGGGGGFKAGGSAYDQLNGKL